MSMRLPARATLSAAVTALALLVLAGAAQADPGTADGFLMSMTVSDTTPAPGETITISQDYDRTVHDDGATSSVAAFGANPAEDAVNLGDLSLVAGSCAGQFSNCAFTPDNRSLTAFHADNPVGRTGDVIAGSAQFTVSPSATDGDEIVFAGDHYVDLGRGPTNSGFTDPITLTVTAPPAADLGVALSAGSGLGHINYDATVTNHGPGAASSATITTQLSSQAVSITSSTCTFSSTTHQASCPIGTLANGASTHATFTANFGLLTIGPVNATATRTASAPSDPNAANDSATANCSALTSLLISC